MGGQFAHEAVDFGFAAQQLDDEALARRVEHPPAGARHVAAHGVATRRLDAQFQQYQFALDVFAARHVLDAHHVDQLLQLVGDLQHHGFRTAGHQRQARHRRVIGRGDRQRFDVVAAAGKHASNARQRAGLVLQQDANDVSHAGQNSQMRVRSAILVAISPMKDLAAIALHSKHPLAGKAMTGAEMIVQVLADEGAEAIFGYSGGAILPTYDAVFTFNEAQKGVGGRQLPLIVPANEQGAGFMAAGYARASGKVGVCLVTSGPGATNTVTPVRDCQADSIPIVVISGQVSRAAIGTDAFQEAPVPTMMGAVAKHIFLVTDPEQLEVTVRTAFEIARTGRPGPVVVDIPKDVQNWKGVFHGSERLPIPGYRQRMNRLEANRLPDAACAVFFAALAAAERPLIYAGGGVINAGASQILRELAREFQIPVVTTLMGIGAVDTTHPLSMRMLGMHGAAFANYAVEDCDFLFAVGARFDDRVAGNPPKFAPGARFIAHLDIDASEINKVKRVDWSHVGLMPDALKSLIDYGRRKSITPQWPQWRARCDALRAKYAMNYDRASPLIQPYYVIEEIN